jgi:predicted secreted protein
MITTAEQPQILGAQRQRRLDQRKIRLARGIGDDQDLLEQGADDDDGDFRPGIDAQHRHRQRAEGRRRQIAEKFHKGSTIRAMPLCAPQRIPSGTPISEEITKPQKIVWMLCQRL